MEASLRCKPYSAYKPSGVAWLGDVPAHWEVRRSDCIVETEKKQISPDVFSGEDVFHYSIPAVQERGTGLIESGESIASAKQSINEPVVLISRLNPRKATICQATPQTLRTLASTEFVALKAKRCDLGFLEYVISSELFRQRLDSWVQSVTRSHQRANPEHIYRFWTAWPTQSEQRAIAAFLDRETGRIDSLVAKKRELIERLQEKRTALISHTVTRGLDPKAKLKPSGLPWLGDIPAHWEAVRLRRRTKRIQTGSTPPTSEDRYYEDGTLAWFGPGSFGADITLSEPVKMLNASAAEEGVARLFRAGTIMVVTIGATLGKVSSLDATASCNQQITAVEIDERRIVPRFAAYQLKRMETALREIAPSATLPILDQGEIADLPFAEPPIQEQQAIADHLDAQTAALDALVRKAEEAIERLQEYRTALITAAVTGKIDVRSTSSPRPI